MNIEIKDLIIKNYNINLTINENEKIGFFGRDNELIRDLLELISGMCSSNGHILVNGNNVFDNKEYFKQRLFFDFKRKYLSTLRVKLIEDKLKNYNLNFNKDKFISICKELDVRGETDITYKYEFSATGNTFVNLALLSSIECKNIIVNNPTINLKFASDWNYFANKLTGIDFDNVLLGLDNLQAFKGKLEHIVFFTDFDEVLLMNKNDTFVAFDLEYEKMFLVKNKIYRGKKLIVANNYSKDDLKNISKHNINYEIISVFDVQKYLGEEV